MRTTWEPAPAGPNQETIFEHLRSAAAEPQEVARAGDPEAALAGQVVTSTFHKGYVAHAPIEPHTALAEFVDGKMTVWASTQTPFGTRDSLVAALGLPRRRRSASSPRTSAAASAARARTGRRSRRRAWRARRARR